jgi:hypothetical protein
MLTTEVRDHNGAPALFLNGRPHNGLMFYHSDAASAAFELEKLAASGIDLVTFYYSVGLSEDGSSDFSAMDEAIRALRAHHPRVMLMPRINLEPPSWWKVRHPSELMVSLDPVTRAAKPAGMVSFASKLWREEYGKALEAFVRHCEQEWPDIVFAYHPAGGAACEWSYSWDHVLSDYSVPQKQAYRAWLRARYGGDIDRLAKSWGDQVAAFDLAEPPTDRLRVPMGPAVLDPRKDRPIIDYLTFHSEMAAEAALYFCHIIKTTLAQLGRRKMCGVFYGYHVWNACRPGWFHNSGHHALEKLLSSSDVDFISSPYFYPERHPGGIYASQAPAASIRYNGKLFYSEEDTRTFLCRPADGAWSTKVDDREGTIAVMRRNFTGALSDGGTQWYMDMLGLGWFRDDELIAEMGRQRQQADRCLSEDRHTAAQVAVIVSNQSAPYFFYDNGVFDSMHGRQIPELARLGAPWDMILASDIERVFAGRQEAPYRLVIFLDTLYLTPSQRQLIARHVARGGRTLLWMYGAGMITEQGISAEAASELAVIRLAIDLKSNDDARVETFITGQRITYGEDSVVSPLLWGQDADAQTLGWLLFPRRPGLLAKDMASWRSIWSAAAGMSASVLRALALRAGVHLYSQADDQVLRAGSLLTLHSTLDGPRKVYLGGPHDVHDALTGQPLAQGAKEMIVDLRRGQTAMWRISPAKL